MKAKTVDVEQLCSADFEIKTRSPKILLLDIESAACVGRFWRNPWSTSIIRIVHDTHMLSWSVKWLDGKQITRSLPDYKGYKAGSRDDKALVEELCGILEQADIVVGHNLKKFDLPYIKGRAVINGLRPIKKLAIYDTRDAAKRHFGFTSNKMDDICRTMGFEPKIPIHFETWEGCESGDMKSWRKMVRYNAHDVSPMLESIYLKFRAWDQAHPNLATISNNPVVSCPSCGSTDYVLRGWDYTVTGRRRAYECKPCGRRYSGKHQKVTDYR